MRCFRVVSGGIGIWLTAGAAAMAGPDGRELLYVGNNRGGTISVIEVPAFKVVGEFDALPDLARSQRAPGSYVDDLVAPSSGEVLYVSRGDARDVAAFSTDRERLLWRVPTHGVADHFALSPDGRRLFVSVENEGRALVIDTAKREVIGQFENGPGPHGMRLSPDGSRVYNGCITGNQLTVADATTFQVLKRIQFDEGVRPFDITPDGRKMFLQLSKLHGFLELDLRSDRITKTVHLPVPEGVSHQQVYPHTAHHGLALTPDGRHLCVGSTVASYMAILSVPELDLLATIPVGKEPSWVIPSLDGRYCYVSARSENTVSVISIDERKEVARVRVGDYPQRMWTVRVPERVP
jgi:YVTN family beta-propeller protein